MPATLSEESTVKPTSPWLKWTLLILLFTSAAAGCFFAALQVRTSAAFLPSLLHAETKHEPGAFGDFQTLLGKATSGQTENTLTCQGMIFDEKGGALAILNGQTTAAGAIINGVRILEITVSNVLVECNGETRRLGSGDRFIFKKP